MDGKICTRCKLFLPREDFALSRTTTTGLQYRCRKCCKESEVERRDKDPDLFKERRRQYCRAWRANNPEKQLAASRRWIAANKEKIRNYESQTQHRRSMNRKLREYGVTVEMYAKMLESQGGGCAICCRKHEERRTLNIDHCHETGEIRGLLCGPCNKALGAFGDNVDGIRKAMRYVEAARTGMFVTEQRRQKDAAK